ncbi:MAG: ribosome silencing factor [Lachnospiraceae bacterium]|nr:ribosome silencing factor [Lachnospiraceae bacterium]
MNQTSYEMVRVVVNALREKKGKDIIALDVSERTVLCDAFVIVTGMNDRQVSALTDAADEALQKAGFEKKNVEGYHTGKWILLDFGDLILHVFDTESRAFYDLERIWRDAERIEIPEE